METLLWVEGMEGKVETRGKRSVLRGNYSACWEDIFETHAGPADRTGFGWKSDCTALDAPAEPVEKLFFLAFDNHRITPNPERMNDRTMRIQFVRKPVRPFRDSWNPVDVCDGSPNKSLARARQQSPSRARGHVSRGKLFRHTNEVTQRLLSPGKLDG